MAGVESCSLNLYHRVRQVWDSNEENIRTKLTEKAGFETKTIGISTEDGVSEFSFLTFDNYNLWPSELGAETEGEKW